ncbi:hypothetical protein Tco_0038003 [Tanacetum coccineum]
MTSHAASGKDCLTVFVLISPFVWITHNYVLHSMPTDFELGVADVGVALAAATAASSGHWMDQILKTHCSLLIYESIFEETTHCNPYSPLPVAVMVQVEATHQLATQLEELLATSLASHQLAASTSRKKLSLSEMQVETELSPGECIGCDYCKTSIFDVHRSCPSCHYDLCLQCCRELRDGNLQGNKEEVVIEFKDSGLDYLQGDGPIILLS